jgi:N-acetylglucosaminyl-diphospho-decaprenol L-rhamnosyltransferase
MSPNLTLSIVSHGQGHLIQSLLGDIDRSLDVTHQLIITLNIPEDETFLGPYAHRPSVRVVRNEHPKGFGANHNAAFALNASPFFAIVNPDIRSERMVLRPMLDLLVNPGIAACGPLIVSPDGGIQDSARCFPSIGDITIRTFHKLTGRRLRPDYDLSTGKPVEVDWVAGMFVIFRTDAYAAVGGFDEGYFMYLEDADICRRLRALHYGVLLDCNSVLVHDAQRASHTSLRHLRWHVASLHRFLRHTA